MSRRDKWFVGSLVGHVVALNVSSVLVSYVRLLSAPWESLQPWVEMSNCVAGLCLVGAIGVLGYAAVVDKARELA